VKTRPFLVFSFLFGDVLGAAFLRDCPAGRGPFLARISFRLARDNRPSSLKSFLAPPIFPDPSADKINPLARPPYSTFFPSPCRQPSPFSFQVAGDENDPLLFFPKFVCSRSGPPFFYERRMQAPRPGFLARPARMVTLSLSPSPPRTALFSFFINGRHRPD